MNNNLTKYRVTTTITVTVFAEDGDDASRVAEQAIRDALEDADIIDADLDGFYEYEEVIT